MLFWAHEAKLPAEKEEACLDAWLSRAPEDEKRSPRPLAPYATRPREACALMPTKYRLARADFTHTRHFRRLHGTFFSYSYGIISGRSLPGAACVVSRKVASSAVARNRIKRRARGPLLELLKGFKAPLIIIATAKKAATEASSAEIAAEIASLSTKLQ